MAGTRGVRVEEVEAALGSGEGGPYLDALDRALADGDASFGERAELLQLRARVHREAMNWAPMQRDAIAAAEAYAVLGDRAREAEALVLCAIATAERGDPLVAAEYAVRAQVIADERSADQSRLHNRLGIFCYQIFAYEAAQDWWQRGLGDARPEDERMRLLFTHNIVEAVVTSIRLDDLESEAGEQLDPMAVAERAVRLRQAEAQARWLCEQGPPEARRLPVDAPRLLGLVLCAQGRAAEAVEVLRAALPARDATSSGIDAAGFDAAYGLALLRTGAAEEAVERLELSVAPRADAVEAETLLTRLDLAEALDLVGRHAEAVQVSRAAVRDMASWLRRHGRSIVGQIDLLAQTSLRASRFQAEASRFQAEASRFQEWAHELAGHVERDPLTGAGNRRRLASLAASLADEPSVGACVLDLDHFKQVNDKHGHAVGDAVLVAVITAIHGICRDDDEIIRLGGEEFVVVLPGASAEATRAAAERLRLAVTRYPWGQIADGLAMTTSVGWSAGPGATLAHTIEAADQALLLAKRRGRDCCVAAPPTLATRRASAEPGGVPGAPSVAVSA